MEIIFSFDYDIVQLYYSALQIRGILFSNLGTSLITSITTFETSGIWIKDYYV